MAFPIPPTRKWDCRICLATVDSSDMGLHIFGDRHIAIVANQLNAARFWKRGDAGKPGPLNGNCENGNSGSLNESAGNRDTLDKSAVDTDGLNSEVQGHDGAMEINDTEKAVDYEDDWNPDEYQFWSGGENELVEGGGGGSGEGDHQ